MEQVDLITISRQFGAGGSELAQALGQQLGWRVLDREIIQAASEKLGTHAADTQHLDEYVTGTFAQLAKDFVMGSPEGFIEPTYEVDPDDLARATHQFLTAAIKRQTPLIVVGHGAQCLFARREHTLHVRVVAPVGYRAMSVAKRTNVTEAAATEEVQNRDKQRAGYLRHHFNVDNNDPILYAVQFNTAFLSVADVTDSVLRLVK